MEAGRAGPSGDDEELWLPALTPSRPRRAADRAGGSAPLSRDRIVAAAITIADREGPDAVGMRRVARDLEVGTMSLYWHVADKDELLALMIDAVEGEFVIPPPSGDWRADLTGAAHSIRAALLRHGWMASFIGYRRTLGPNELRHIESSLAILGESELGLAPADALKVLMAVETYVLGFASRDQQELRTEREALQRLSDDPGSSALPEVVRFVERLGATGRYPRLTQLFAAGMPHGRDERFDYGLECLLDGIETDLRGA